MSCKKYTYLLLVSFFTLFFGSGTYACEEGDKTLQVKEAYVRAPLPGQKMTVAYLILRNCSETSRTLVSVSTAFAAKAEIHQNLHHDAMMRMRHIKQLPLAAGAQLKFEANSYHIMLMGVKKPLAQSVPLTLTFADGQTLQVQAELRHL